MAILALWKLKHMGKPANKIEKSESKRPRNARFLLSGVASQQNEDSGGPQKDAKTKENSPQKGAFCQHFIGQDDPDNGPNKC